MLHTRDMHMITRPLINGARLWSRHEELAQIGVTSGGGVNRQALSDEDSEARKLFLSWCSHRGYAAEIDPIGNLFIRRPGLRPDLAPVMTGSHLDTQPTGGNYDGIYGVLSGLEVLEALDDAEILTQHPIELVVWMNEEGSRFAPTTMGSAVYAGKIPLEDMLRVCDSTGVSVRQALTGQIARLPALKPRALGSVGHAYVEAHIEQGPVLENAGKQIGIVEVIQGLFAYQVEVTGFEAHAGTTPNSARRDALVAAISLIDRLREIARDEQDQTRFTVGRFEVHPGSPNTVPGKVQFSIDLRHPDAARLASVGEQILRVCLGRIEGCEVTAKQVLASAPVHFDPRILDVLQAKAKAGGLSHMRMISGATHDAKYVAVATPAAMLFIPCAEGISHNERESITQDAAVIGAQLLCDVLLELARPAHRASA